MLASGRLIIELWPSIDEIHTSKMENKYTGRLTEFYESLDILLKDLRLAKLPVEPYTNIQLEKGKLIARAFPPEVVELITWLRSSGIALALYKALKLWVDFKNGRRIKIVDGSLEVEATQLSEKQFSKLLDLVQEFHKKLAPADQVKISLQEKGFSIRSVGDIERFEEHRVLHNAAREKKEE